MKLTLVYPEVHRRGGVERVAFEAAVHLSRHHDVTVVCSRDGADTLPPEVRVLETAARARRSTLAMLQFRREAAQVIRGLAPDRTVTFGSDCPEGDVLAVQSVHRAWVERGGPIRYGGIEIPPTLRQLLPRHQARLALEKYSCSPSRRTHFVAVAPGVADDLEHFYGIPADRMSVVPNGYDPLQCSPARRSALRDRARATASIAPDETVLLMVANEWHRKGLGVLIGALSLLPRPRPLLVLVGRSPLGIYEARIRQLGLGDRVRYLGPRADVSEAHALADLLVLPTQYEAFGIVIVEALASGLPVITTSLAGAADVVRPGRTGLLQQDPGDPQELEALLVEALEGNHLKEWSSAANDSVRDYTWASVMDKFEAVVVGGH